MKEYGIIGYPLSYTLSPPMQNAAFRELGIPACYAAYPVEQIEEGVEIIKEKPLHGASVTIPHKISIMDLLDRLDEEASLIGAVNTVVRRGETLEGYNTDWIGAVRALEELVSLADREVLLIGAGGSARAVAYGITGCGGKLWVANRDENKGREVAATFGGRFLAWRSIPEIRLDVVINATPLFPPFPPDALVEGMVVMDLAYGPGKTAFLAEAEKRGCTVVDGLRMLLYQGIEQFLLWTGEAAPVRVMEEALYG